MFLQPLFLSRVVVSLHLLHLVAPFTASSGYRSSCIAADRHNRAMRRDDTMPRVSSVSTGYLSVTEVCCVAFVHARDIAPEVSIILFGADSPRLGLLSSACAVP